MRILNVCSLGFIYFYRLCLSPFKCPCCRFTPTCSQYALQAFTQYPFRKAIFFTTKRLLKCHPWGSCGYDPLPENKKKKEKK